jgi:hypothetical protein
LARRRYSNIAPPQALTSGVSAAATSLSVGSTANYPAVPFTIGLERGTIKEEVCLCTATTATTLTVTRGYDGTTAQTHDAGAIVEHTVAAIDYDEANAHLNASADGSAHPANTVAYSGSTNLAATNVEAALDELDAEKAAAAAATAAGTSYAGGTGMSATTVEGAIDELADEKENVLRSISTQTTAYTIGATDSVVLCNGTFTVTLPTAVGRTGKTYEIKNIGTGTVTVDGNGSQTIDGALTFVLDAQYEAITIISDGSNWWVI